MFLEQIVEKRRGDLERYQQYCSVEEMRERAYATRRIGQSLYQQLAQTSMGIIAEIKKASPSLGEIVKAFDVEAIAKIYDESDAIAISVLTEPHFFLGDYQHLESVRTHTQKPILNKDFIVHPWQIYQAKIIGADVILLIVAILSDQELQAYYELAYDLGLEVLVEVHTKDELERCLRLRPQMIGINNRDLKTFETHIETTVQLAEQVPRGCCLVSESGIRNKEQINRLRAKGVKGLLVGESLMKASDPQCVIKELIGADSL
ncbi:MAG: indole-3-glycerol phosphate synthase TrpC [Cellulosilyticaceae bacterium]